VSTKELAAIYGKNKNSTQLVNAAVRTEIPGGSEALDALDELRSLHENRGLPETATALKHARAIVDAMAAEIRKRYDMPPREE
jgi:hypothetical protein